MSNPILQNLKSTSMSLRKAKDPMGAFLVTVLSDANALAKGDTKEGVTPEVDDTYLMRAIRTNLKQQDEMISLATAGSDGQKLAESKKAILTSLLPAQATSDDIKKAAETFIETLEKPVTKKAIGPTMAYLTEKFGASLDKATASKVIQSLI